MSVQNVYGYSNMDIMTQEARRKALLAQQAQQQMVGSVEESIMTQDIETKGHKCTDGKDDGKIGFWKATGHALKGAGKFLGGLLGFEWNTDGSYKGWSLGKTVKNIAIGAGIAAVCVLTAGTAVPAIIAGAGVLAAAGGVGTSVYRAATAKTDAECKAAFEDVGSNTLALTLSVTGAKASMKAYNPTGNYSGIKGTWNAVKESTTLPFTKGWQGIKAAHTAYKAGGVQAVKTIAVDAGKSFWSTVKTNWNNATKVVTPKEKHDNQMKKYDDDINSLKSQIDEATDAGTRNQLKTQKRRLEQQKANIEKAYREIDAEKTFANAQSKIDDLNTQIAAKQRQIDNAPRSIEKVKYEHELAQLKQQAEVYKNVVDYKTTQARNIQAELKELKAKKELTTADKTRIKDLQRQQRELKFDLPKGKKETFAATEKSATEYVVKKQQAYDKAKAELAEAEKAYKKFAKDDPSDEAMLAANKYFNAKQAVSNAAKQLDGAKIQLNTARAYSNTANGYDTFGTFTAKANTFKSTFDNLYGTANIPVVGGKQIPFTQFNVPTSVPKSWAIPAVAVADKGATFDDVLMAEMMGITPQEYQILKAAQNGDTQAQETIAKIQALANEQAAAIYMAQQQAAAQAYAQQPVVQPTYTAPQATTQTSSQTGATPPSYQDLYMLDQYMKSMYGIA